MKIKQRSGINRRDLKGDAPATQATRLCIREHDSTKSVVTSHGPFVVAVPYDQTFAVENDAKTVWTSTYRIQSVVSSASGTVSAVDEKGIVATGIRENGGSLKLREDMSLLWRPIKEDGWHGLSMSNQSERLACTSQWGMQTVLSTGESFTHESPPTSICASGTHPDVFFVAEWNDITLWDARAPRGGFVDRLMGNQLGGGGSGPLWSCESLGNYIVAGGEDRTVSILDERKLRLVDTWKTPLKDDIVALRLSNSGTLICVALGLDHEICSWSPNENLNLRTDATSTNGDDEERRADLGRLHHNHRIFRAKGRWTGGAFCGSTFIAQDTDGIIYEFAL